MEVLETSLAKALDLLRPAPASFADKAGALRDELARLDTEVARLATAIAVGGDLQALVVSLHERERRRQQLRAQLAAIERHAAAPVNATEILDRLRGHLTDWQGMLRQEAPQARQALKALLAGRLTFTPREVDGQRFYEFEGPGTLDKVIAGIVLPKSVVTPGGYASITSSPVLPFETLALAPIGRR